MTGAAQYPAARILIVDDQLTHQRKMQHAVQALGYTAETADSGPKALSQLKQRRFDLVLLDILMPDMDGYEVMQFMQRDPHLADIPVIVVSALESEMKAVVRAVEMGAEDVLPKHFDAVLLSARLDSALERRSVRLREQDTRAHMSTLMEAATKVDRHGTRSEFLRLEQTCNRSDAIGRLARVFVQMTTEVQLRDRQLQRQLDIFRTLALACVTGIVLGLGPALAGSLDADIPSIAALAALVSATGALVCLTTLLWRRPHESLTRLIRLGAIFAVFAGLLGLLPLLWLSTQLPAWVVAGVLPLELAAALIVRSVLSEHRLNPYEICALVLCVIGGVCLVVLPTGSTTAWTAPMAIAAVLPAIGFAAATHGLSVYEEPADNATGEALSIIGIAASLLTLALLPFVLIRGDANDLLTLISQPGPGISVTALTIVMLAIVLVTGATLRMLLARQSGPVAVALSMLCVMAAAPIWSMLLLDAQPSLWIAVPLAAFVAATIAYACRANSDARALLHHIDVELA